MVPRSRGCELKKPSDVDDRHVRAVLAWSWTGALSDAQRIAMGRFASTVAYYESARPPYGSAFFAAVARQLLAFNGRQRLLDVGAGPGILAIGFAPYCREVMGVDPEPGMVEAARAAAARADAAVRFIHGRFEDVAGNSAHSTSSPSAAQSTGSIPSRPKPRSSAPSPRTARFSSAARQAPRTGAIRGSTLSTLCVTAGRASDRHAITIHSLLMASSPERERSGSRRRTRFLSNASLNASCRCRPLRRIGLATRFP